MTKPRRPLAKADSSNSDAKALNRGLFVTATKPRVLRKQENIKLYNFADAVENGLRIERERKNFKKKQQGKQNSLTSASNYDKILELEPDKSKRIFSLKLAYGYDDKLAEEADFYLTSRFTASSTAAQMPDQPVREYVARQDNIVAYLKADDGFGPWWRAGLLTRPLIREKSPKAYMALANWLRTNPLPDDLPIPTKSETIDQALSGLGPTAAARLGHAAASRLRRL